MFPKISLIAAAFVIVTVQSVATQDTNSNFEGSVTSQQPAKPKRATSGSLDQALSTFPVRHLSQPIEEDAGTSEQVVWDALGAEPAPDEIVRFLEQFPDGELEVAAKQRLLKALEAELGGEQTEPEEDIAAAEPEVVATTPEPTIPEPSLQSFEFTTALTSNVPHISGKSISQLVDSSPLHPPLEDLPESYWKDQKCSSCHEWNQERLCVQAQFYMTEAGALRMIKKHPLGGEFKKILRDWAVQGCN